MTLAARIRPARSLAALARPSLEALAGSAGEAAGLSVRDGDQVHYIEQVGSPNPVSVRDWTGSRIPLHAVSSGQVLLAFSPPTYVQRYVGRPMESFTERTLVTADALFERMRAIRRDGYTWALEEFDEGISSVAAPVADVSGEVVAAVHLHGPSYRFPSPGRRMPWPTRWSRPRRGSRGACARRVSAPDSRPIDCRTGASARPR